MYHPQIFIHPFKLCFFTKKYYFKIQGRALLLNLAPLLIGCGLSFSLFASIQGNNSHLVTPEKLKEVNLVYYQYFPCHRLNCHRHVKGCRVVYRSTVSNPVSHWFFQCTATMQFLRPAKTVKKWQVPDNSDHLLTEINNPNISSVHSRMIAVRETTANSVLPSLAGQSQNRVTGKFKRYVLDVRRYTFKTIKTGTINTVNATPGHPFYVAGKHRFMPVTNISSQDRLITASGEQVQLLCHPEQKKHCGIPINRGLPVPVFNFEVDQRHVYFIGDTAVMVHNNCNENDQAHVKELKSAFGDMDVEWLSDKENPFNSLFSGQSRPRKKLIDPISSREIPYKQALRLISVDDKGHTIKEPNGAAYSLNSLLQLGSSNPDMLNESLEVQGKLVGLKDSRNRFFKIKNLPAMFFNQTRNRYQLSPDARQKRVYLRTWALYHQEALSKLKQETWMLHGTMASAAALMCVVLGLHCLALFY